MATTNIEVGKTYKVVSQRKGTFTGMATQVSDEWVTVLITTGKAMAMLDYNERDAGEEVTVRRSLTAFTLVEGGAA
jgi:hypothetical protein